MQAHKVSLLVVIGHAPTADLARSFVASVDRIARFVAAQEPRFIAKVYRPSKSEIEKDPGAPGRVELWYPQA